MMPEHPGKAGLAYSGHSEDRDGLRQPVRTPWQRGTSYREGASLPAHLPGEGHAGAMRLKAVERRVRPGTAIVAIQLLGEAECLEITIG